jgi:hypothetical protein
MSIRFPERLTSAFSSRQLTKDDSLSVTDLPQSLQPSLRSRNVSTFTQDGLDDNTSDLVRWDLLLEEQRKVGQGEIGHVVDRGVGWDVELGCIGERSRVDSGL